MDNELEESDSDHESEITMNSKSEESDSDHDSEITMDSEPEDSDSSDQGSEMDVVREDGEDSSSEGDYVTFENFFEENEAAASATARGLVVQYAEPIQATKELWALQNKPQLLEKLVLKCLESRDAADTLIQQKRIFKMMPPPLKEKINRECPMWRQPPLVGMMADPRTRHISLYLRRAYRRSHRPPRHLRQAHGRWTRKDLRLFCKAVARKCKTTLQSLEICNPDTPEDKRPGLTPLQICWLLSELRALTSLSLYHESALKTNEIDLLVSTLASTNPGIRSLSLPYLSNKNLLTIADRWPELETLESYSYKFNYSHIKAVLPRLRNLRTFGICSVMLTKAMVSVARAYDPTTPPYKLTVELDISQLSPPISSGDMIQVFTAFPDLSWMTLQLTDIPAVCAGLEGREQVRITKLVLLFPPSTPSVHSLEPLLARLGPHLTDLSFNYGEPNPIDLNMIGHYCPKLTDFLVEGGDLISSDGFEITETYFAELEHCTLCPYPGENGPTDLPAALLCRTLASPNLKAFTANGAVSITDEVVAALVAVRGALSSLNILTIWDLAASVEALAQLASHAPCLQSFFLSPLVEHYDADYWMKLSVLTSFMQQSELRTKVCEPPEWMRM